MMAMMASRLMCMCSAWLVWAGTEGRHRRQPVNQIYETIQIVFVGLPVLEGGELWRAGHGGGGPGNRLIRQQLHQLAQPVGGVGRQQTCK
jgi:hypothetical protein